MRLLRLASSVPSALLRAEMLVDRPQPWEHHVDQVAWIGFFLADVAPFTGLVTA